MGDRGIGVGWGIRALGWDGGIVALGDRGIGVGWGIRALGWDGG